MFVTALVLVSASPGSTEPSVKTFDRWIAGCDNENVCTAIRPGWDAVDILPEMPGAPFLQIRHHPHRNATPEFSLRDPENPAPLATLKSPLVTLVIHFNDNEGVGNARIYRAAIDGEGGYRFQDEDARSILYGLRRGRRAVVSIADKRGFSFDPTPFEDVLAFFDRKQDLADTPGALVLQPENVMYDYAHPVPPEADTVQLSTFNGEQLHNWKVEYPERMPDEIIEVEAKPDRGLVNLIRAKSLEGDCGIFERWGHVGTGNDFVLVERREMPVCKGFRPVHWIQTYRADTISPG